LSPRDDSIVWYFAYGSNMDPKRMQDRDVGYQGRYPAVLKNWRLAFNKAACGKPGVGYANVVPMTSERVEGVLYRLPKESDLSRLDRFEGAPAHYKRHRIEVEKTDTGEKIKAFTYIAQPERVQEGLKPLREYMNHLLAGADCLSESYLERLRQVETYD